MRECISKKRIIQEASERFEFSTRINPLNYVSWYNLGVVSGLNADAIQYYTECLKIKPDYYQALNNRGKCYSCLRMNDEAINDFNVLLSLYPENIVGLYNRVLIYKNIGKYDESISDLQKIIKIDPKNKESLILLCNIIMNWEIKQKKSF